jgi:hypothetical protein
MYPYQPRKVVVLGLVNQTEDVLAEYFGMFGDVVEVIMKIRPTNAYAFVEFGHQHAVETVLATTTHTVGGLPVRVLRAYRPKLLPSRPFPGMDRAHSPLREALMQRMLAESGHICATCHQPVRAAAAGLGAMAGGGLLSDQWDHDTYRAIVSLWD